MKIENSIAIIAKDIYVKQLKETEKIKLKKYSLLKIIDNYSKEEVTAIINEKILIIPKKYIAVNICDIMQEEVIYNIVNSKQAIYNIHGHQIPNVSGKKLYPNMKINNKLFIPLMFGTAEKLYKAEEEFLKQNLTIKIYDAYRPYEITKYLYKILLDLLDEYYDYLNGEINGHKYDQTDFLAAKTSTHNHCIALDMTLVDLNTKQELEMQSKMHDLSIYSVTDYNNDNAKMLAKIMEKQGFYPLESEWWHFQDNSSKEDYLDFYITDDGKIQEYE